jgi:hypothetical protein
MLCSLCKTLHLSIDSGRDIDVAHHENVADILRSGETGCDLCRIISRACVEQSKASGNNGSIVSLKLKKDLGIIMTVTTAAVEEQDQHGDCTKTFNAYVPFECYEIPGE